MTITQVTQFSIRKLRIYYTKTFKSIGPIFFMIILFIPLILCLLWFKEGQILMAAEEGPIFNNPQHTAKLYGQTWTDSGLGLANPLITPRIPFYLFAGSLASLSIPPVYIQQILFFTLILISLISMFFLFKIYFPKYEMAGKVTSVFYVLNIYVQSQIWNRFLFPQIFLWSYLPLFLLIYTLWLKSSKVKHLFFLVVSSFIFSLTFSFISSLFVLWIPAAIITVGFIFPISKKSHKYFLIGIFALILWIITNLWWITPIATIKDNNYSALLDPNRNITSLVEVSKFYPNSSLLILKQDYFFNRFSDWNTTKYFNQTLFMIFVITIIGVLSQINKKSGFIFTIIFFVGWLVSKGTNPPYGFEFFSFLFSNFPVTQVLRNPYEKFGLVFLLPYAIFFGIGITKVFRHKILISLVVIYCCTTLVKPIWNGSIFNGYKATVPQDYKEINIQLDQSNAHRLLSLPFLHLANVEYKWGYKGEELSELLITKPTLSRTYNAPGDLYPLIYQYLKRPDFPKLLPIFVIDHIILHHDVVYTTGYQENDTDSLNIINQWKNISLIKKTENLTLFRYNKPIHWGYIAYNLIPVNTPKEGLDQIFEEKINPYTEAFIENDLKLTTIKFENSQTKYSVTKLSPDHYKVNIQEAKNPYVFVLSTTFNNNWQAKINDKTIYEHFKVNGYANGWIINDTGNYTIEFTFNTFKSN